MDQDIFFTDITFAGSSSELGSKNWRAFLGVSCVSQKRFPIQANSGRPLASTVFQGAVYVANVRIHVVVKFQEFCEFQIDNPRE